MNPAVFAAERLSATLRNCFGGDVVDGPAFGAIVIGNERLEARGIDVRQCIVPARAVGRIGVGESGPGSFLGMPAL